MVNRIDVVLWAGVLSATLLASAPARGEETEPGVWWEQTYKMEMKGMPMAMPPQTHKVCVAKGGMKEPPKGDDSCKTTDMKVVGNKTTWKVECSRPEPMSGEGEMTSFKDHYSGVMTMHGSQGDMTMNLTGKLLGGDCDAGAVKKQAAAFKKQVDEQQAQSRKAMDDVCAKAADEMSFRMFTGPGAMCKDPAQVSTICDRLATRPGYLAYRRVARSDPGGAQGAEALCKKDPEAIRGKLCADAVRETRGDATPRPTLQFLASACPEEARAFAMKACAGRSYSGNEGMDDPLRDICVQYAKEELAKGDPKKAPPEEKKNPKDQAVDSAKKALKGLFGK